jgi:hypothetical protein
VTHDARPAVRPEVVDALYRFDITRLVTDPDEARAAAGWVDDLRLVRTATEAEVDLAAQMRMIDCEQYLAEARRMLLADPHLRDEVNRLLERDHMLAASVGDLIRTTLHDAHGDTHGGCDGCDGTG